MRWPILKIITIISYTSTVCFSSRTIPSLKSQSLQLRKIIVVNDGSTDGTGKLARSLGCLVVDLPYHKGSYVGRPELAKAWNAGLKRASIDDPDYILLVDADHPLPPNYVELLVSRMEANPKLVVSSGRIEGEPYVESAPRGSGRLVKALFWRNVNNLQYPIVWGWQSWLCLKAIQMGYETFCFKDIRSKVLRQTGRKINEVENWGKGMYALGYDWKYAMERCLGSFAKSPKMGLSMFWGWIRHKGVQRLDIADWVNQMQKKRFWSKVCSMIKHGDRK